MGLLIVIVVLEVVDSAVVAVNAATAADFV